MDALFPPPHLRRTRRRRRILASKVESNKNRPAKHHGPIASQRPPEWIQHEYHHWAHRHRHKWVTLTLGQQPKKENGHIGNHIENERHVAQEGEYIQLEEYVCGVSSYGHGRESGRDNEWQSVSLAIAIVVTLSTPEHRWFHELDGKFQFQID